MEEPRDSWRGRSVLVTGGAVRIGRAIARAFAQAGADVVVHYRSSEAQAREAAAEIRALGVRAALVQGDQARDGDPERIVAQAAHAHGRLDALICNAAGFEEAPAAELTRARFDAMLAANLSGPFQLARAAWPHLRARQGSIVNLLDLCGTTQVWEKTAHYAASKAGLAVLTRQLALEWAPEVRVNAVAPGAILLADSFPEARRERILSRIPAGRLGTPEEVARAVVFLASEPFITGQVVVVDGGRSVAP
jgi:NAD(P)-dependent dehydrogenase (short-subunit alcohol dehydrogenase family)